MPAPSSSRYQVSELPLKLNPVEERIPPAVTPEVLAKCPECGLKRALEKLIVYFNALAKVGLKVLLILILVMLFNIAGSTSSIKVVNFEYLKTVSNFSNVVEL